MKAKFLSLLFMLLAAQFVAAQTTDKNSVKAQTASRANLEIYKGSYISDSNSDVSIIYVSSDKLMLKIPGRPSIAMAAEGKNTFKSEKGDTQVEFDTKNKLFVMSENGKKETYKMQ